MEEIKTKTSFNKMLFIFIRRAIQGILERRTITL